MQRFHHAQIVSFYCSCPFSSLSVGSAPRVYFEKLPRRARFEDNYIDYFVLRFFGLFVEGFTRRIFPLAIRFADTFPSTYSEESSVLNKVYSKHGQISVALEPQTNDSFTGTLKKDNENCLQPLPSPSDRRHCSGGRPSAWVSHFMIFLFEK